MDKYPLTVEGDWGTENASSDSKCYKQNVNITRFYIICNVLISKLNQAVKMLS